MEKKKVIVVGGGASGLCTGVYLQMNGYDAVVLEKNACVGGACVGWERKNCYIDGCIHWLVGVNKLSSLNPLWKQTGALTDDIKIYNPNDFYTLDFGKGKKFTIWSNLERLQSELITFAPEDERQIKKFCKLIKRFEKINVPVEKPVDLMNLFDLLKIAFTMAGDYYYVNKTSKISCEAYANKFKNPYIRKWLSEHMSAGYNLMSFLYMLSHVTAEDGGIPEGGSMAFSQRIADKFISLGGTLKLGAEVDSINVQNNVATGVTLKNGQTLSADWVIATTPVEHLLKKLLMGKYPLKSIDFRLADRKTYPIYTYTSVAFKINADMSYAPLSHKIYFDEPIALDTQHFSATYRNYSYDKTLKAPEGCSIVQATLSGNDDMYFWWDTVKKNGNYKTTKQQIAERLLQIYLEKHPELDGKIEIIDVVTPLTYQRYLNGRHGSFQGFVQTFRSKALMQKGEIKGLKNFILSGQWILRSGGLPTAVITGKFAVQRICKKDKIKFKTT